MSIWMTNDCAKPFHSLNHTIMVNMHAQRWGLGFGWMQ
jgi:hypothetical protein